MVKRRKKNNRQLDRGSIGSLSVLSVRGRVPRWDTWNVKVAEYRVTSYKRLPNISGQWRATAVQPSTTMKSTRQAPTRGKTRSFRMARARAAFGQSSEGLQTSHFARVTPRRNEPFNRSFQQNDRTESRTRLPQTALPLGCCVFFDWTKEAAAACDVSAAAPIRGRSDYVLMRCGSIHNPPSHRSCFHACCLL